MADAGWVLGSRGALGGPDVEFVLWVATAVGSGGLGNAAYDGLKLTVGRFRRREKLGVIPASPRLVDDEVVLMARLAVRVLRTESGLDAGGLLEVGSMDWSGEEWRWVVEVRDQHGAVYCSVADGDPTDVLVYGSRG